MFIEAEEEEEGMRRTTTITTRKKKKKSEYENKKRDPEKDNVWRRHVDSSRAMRAKEGTLQMRVMHKHGGQTSGNDD